MPKRKLRVWALEALVATNLNEIAIPAAVEAAYPGVTEGTGVDPRMFAGNGRTDTALVVDAISRYGIDDPMAIQSIMLALPKVSHDILMSRRANVIGSRAARTRIRADRAEGIEAGVLSPMSVPRTHDLLVAAGFSPDEDFGGLRETSMCFGLGSTMVLGYDQIRSDLVVYDVEFVTMADAEVPEIADLLGADVIPFD